MITKIVMSDVASYKAQATLETDKKVNLIYGLNGTGKSTLSNFLYAPAGLEYAGCSIDGASDAEILVYNGRFVRDHFHETDRLNGIFTVSKENAQAEKELDIAQTELKIAKAKKDNLESDIQQAARALEKSKSTAEDSAWEIKTKYSGGDRVLEFCLDKLMGKKSKLFEHIASLPKPAVKPQRTIEEIKHESETIGGEDAQHFSLLPTITFDAASLEIDQIFKAAIVGNQDSIIAGLISRLENADWVKEGVVYLDVLASTNDEACPFCQAKTISKTVSDEIRGYFNESYKHSLGALRDIQENYQNAIRSVGSVSLHKASPFMECHVEELSDKYERFLDLLRRNIDRIDSKIKNPSQEQILEESSDLLSKINELVLYANERILEHNIKIDNKKQELKRISSEFWQIMRWDYDPIISVYDKAEAVSKKQLSEKLQEIEAAEQELHRLGERISETQKTTVNVDSAIESINAGLIDLGIESFNVVKHNDNLYRIVREGEKESDFHTLSEGEKTVISFLYFVERCKGRKNTTDVAGNKVVVIDDPISSLSHVYVFNVGQLIKTEFFNSSRFDQVFVFTHSLYFFYDLTDINHERRKATQKLFRLTKNMNGSRVIDMKYEEVQNDYQAYWSIVKDPDQPSPLIANCMRNIIEYFFGFVERRDFQNVFQKPELKANRYQAFNRFMNRESHSIGQNVFDYKEFDFTLFHESLKLVFEENGFSEHYATMMKA